MKKIKLNYEFMLLWQFFYVLISIINVTIIILFTVWNGLLFY